MNIGDQVLYTGAYRDCCAWLTKGQRAAVWTIERGDMTRPGGVVYLKGPGYSGNGANLACYAGDVAFAAPAEPEEYETWFV